MEIILVFVASLLAGLVDAVVGGGGLILVPTLFAVFPAAPPPTLLGTNKGASVWGTSIAAWRFARTVQLHAGVLVPAAAISFGMAFVGSWLVTQINPSHMRQALPLVLLGLLVYTVLKKDLGTSHAPRHSQQRETVLACVIGGCIGFYDGFFGPGTGSFLVFLLVRVLGYDFVHASANAKFINMASNLASILLFASTGHIWWHLVLVMAVANVIGSAVGSHLTLKHGAGFVRKMFLLVVSALILRTSWDALPAALRSQALAWLSSLF